MPKIDNRKPKKTTGGMAALSVLNKLGPRAEATRGFHSHLLEMFNLSNGERTVREIARILNYEIGEIHLEAVRAAFNALNEQGLVTWKDEERTSP